LKHRHVHGFDFSRIQLGVSNLKARAAAADRDCRKQCDGEERAMLKDAIYWHFRYIRAEQAKTVNRLNTKY
jgi:hypothetical protein